MSPDDNDENPDHMTQIDATDPGHVPKVSDEAVAGIGADVAFEDDLPGAGDTSTGPAPDMAAETAVEGAADVAPENDITQDSSGDPSRMKAIIESLLFVSDKPLTIDHLRHILEVRDAKLVKAALDALIEDSAKGRGVVVHEVAGGYQLRSAPESAQWVQKVLASRPVRLSRPQLETMSIIAYRQPITRAEVDEIRGVDSGAVIKLLMDRNLIRIIGKKEEPGRPMLYGTTKEFLEFFNLKDLRDLPTLREFHELSQESQAKVDALEESTESGAAAAERAEADAAAATVGAPAAEPAPTPDPTEITES